MKKYVKPMIECEEFVANEYCQGCWKISCADEGHDEYFYVYKEPTDGLTNIDRRGFRDDGFDQVLDYGWYYIPQDDSMRKFSHEPLVDVPVYNTKGYKVNVTPGNPNGTGPNAS